VNCTRFNLSKKYKLEKFVDPCSAGPLCSRPSRATQRPLIFGAENKLADLLLLSCETFSPF